MTALSLRAIVTEALADIGVVAPPPPDKSRVRKTEWLPGGHGIGLRHYTSGRRVYVAQSRMGGRVRTVTIGPASVITEAQAITVARRVLAHAFVGNDPAETRNRVLGIMNHGNYSVFETVEMVPENKALFRRMLADLRARYTFNPVHFEQPEQAAAA